MKITIVGDIMCEPPILEAAKRPDGSYDFAPMYEKVVPMFREADYVIGNMETTLAGEELEYTQTFFSFNAPDSFGTAAKEAGIDLVSLINNHTLDRGAEGIVRTMQTMEKIGLPYVGVTPPERERQGAYYFERNGVRFAVVSYTYGINKHLTEDDPVAQNLNRLAVFGNIVCDEKIYPTSWVDELYPELERAEQNVIRKEFQLPYLPEQINGIINHEKVDACFAQMAADIRTAKENADFVIFFPHIGGQFNTRVGKFSEYAAQVAMEAGADAVSFFAQSSQFVFSPGIDAGSACAIMFAGKQLGGDRMKEERTVCQELKVLNQMIKRRADAVVSQLFDQEITDMQGRVIGFLYHNRTRPIYQKDVEAAFSITRATTSKMLTLMEKNGLITRQSVEYDGRLKELRLTEKALEFAIRVGQGLEEFEEIVTRGMTEDEKEVLLTLLQKLENNVSDSGRKGECAVC